MDINKKLRKIIFGSISILVLVIAVFYWNEARKEVVFLCSNFKQGVPEQSVRRQLDTANLLRYRTENLSGGGGKRIIVDSPLNLFLYTCIIEIDEGGVVEESHLE